MNQVKNIIYGFLASLLTLLLGLIILELIFGNWFDNKWEEVARYNIPLNKKITYDVSKLNYGYKKSLYIRDEYGLRVNCPYKDVDMITIGGSTTDQRSITQTKTFQSQIENLYKQDYKDSICIANAGIDGHSTTGNLFALNHWLPLIPELNPKLYLLYVGINDAGLTGILEDMDDKRRYKFDFIDKIKSKSAVYRLVKIIKNEIKIRLNKTKYIGHQYKYLIKSIENYPVTKIDPESFIKAEKNSKLVGNRIKQMISIINNKDAKAICVTQPHAMAWSFNNEIRGVENAHAMKSGIDYNLALEMINNEFTSICRETGNYVIEINSNDFELTDFYDYVHLNQVGTNKLSEKLYNQMKKMNIFDNVN